LKSVEEDLNNMGARNWRSKSQDQEQWRSILEGSPRTEMPEKERQKERKRKKENWNTKDSAPNDSIP
jgi:hypothetical protein